MKAVKIVTMTFPDGLVVQDYRGYNVDSVGDLIEFVGKNSVLINKSDFRAAISGEVVETPVAKKEETPDES